MDLMYRAQTWAADRVRWVQYPPQRRQVRQQLLPRATVPESLRWAVLGFGVAGLVLWLVVGAIALVAAWVALG